ncbi:MAG: hypothetical protein L6W00_26615 [Lentisphaeria bacterium]|nr:MAG: hypothetical protein L6W00_26615 [Lentisphaeria bacterium]
MKKCLLFGFGMLIALLLGVAAVRCFSPGGEERDGGNGSSAAVALCAASGR